MTHSLFSSFLRAELPVEVFLHVDGGAATTGSGHDGLAVVRVGNITGGKHTLDHVRLRCRY